MFQNYEGRLIPASVIVRGVELPLRRMANPSISLYRMSSSLLLPVMVSNIFGLTLTLAKVNAYGALRFHTAMSVSVTLLSGSQVLRKAIVVLSSIQTLEPRVNVTTLPTNLDSCESRVHVLSSLLVF